MADGYGYGYGGFAGVPYPYWLYPHPPASTPAFLASHPAQSYDQTRLGFDPMAPHHQSPSSGDNTGPPTPFSYFYTGPGDDQGHEGEDSSKDKYSSQGGYYPSMETPSSGVVYSPPMAPPYSSATVSSLADMLMRNSREPFYVPVPPSGVCATRNAFDLNRPGHYYSGYGAYESGSGAAVSPPPPPPVVPYLCVPSMRMPTFSGGSQTGMRVGDGRSFGNDIQSGTSVERVVGYGEAAGHVKPLSENPDLGKGTVGSKVSMSPRSSQPLQFDAKSSLYQRTDTLVAESGNGVSGSSLKSAIGDLNYDERHESWNHCMVSSKGPSAPAMFSVGSESCGAVKADNPAQSAVSYENHSEGSANQPSEDVQAKTCKLQEQFDKKSTLLTDLGIKGSSRSNADGVSTGQSPVFVQRDFTSPASSKRVSSVVNGLHVLSEVLVYECFNNKSLLNREQLEGLDKVVAKLTKCLKKMTGNKTVAGEASVPTQAIHVSSQNVVDLSESIKNILASNFPDGEENHPQTLLYKNLWLETEAALCSTTCLARYHRIQNETANLKSQNREVSADASTFVQEPFLNHQKSVSIINKVEQETDEPLIKHGSTFGNNVVTMRHDAPQSSRFNSAPVEAVLSRMSRSFTGCLEQENDGNFKPGVQIPDTIEQESPASATEKNLNVVIDRFQILKQQETKRKLKSQNCSDPDIVVIDRFQILEEHETNGKLKSQNLSETRMDDQKEDNLEVSERATIGRSSHMSDVMGRFQMLKRREAEQVQKSLNSVDFDSDSDSDFVSDSDSDQPRNKTQRCDYLLSDSMMTIGGNSQIETCVNTEPSAYEKGYESPTSDWEYVLKDD